MVSGFATSSGTSTFAKNHPEVTPQNFKKFNDLTLSNVGIGTYLGEANDATDTLVKNAVKSSVLSGVNVIDTAINYRAQKAERSVGRAISDLIESGKISRDQVFVSTKNGYVTNDADVKQDFWEYIKAEYTQKGIVSSGDISSGYHCMTVPYLEDQLNRSLKNLNLDCIDLLYLHNAVEGQQDLTREQFLKNLKSVFELYEEKRKEGLIKFYGLATWECFRVNPDNPQYLSLEETLHMAKQIGGENHGFRFIQLPYNMYYDQAFMQKNQQVSSQNMSILDASRKCGIGVFTSVPFMQGRLLADGVMPDFDNLSAPLRALQFIRSTPGVISPLVGQKSESHVKENLEILKIPPLQESDFVNLVKKLTA